MTDRPDVKAGEAYVRLHGLTPLQAMQKIVETTDNDELRSLLTEIIQDSKLQAKIEMLATWYDGTDRSEHRLAAMLARRYGNQWWLELRKEQSTEQLLGLIDDAWHASFVEPHLEAIARADATDEMIRTDEAPACEADTEADIATEQTIPPEHQTEPMTKQAASLRLRPDLNDRGRRVKA